MVGQHSLNERSDLDALLAATEEFDAALVDALDGTGFKPFNSSNRVTSGAAAASVAWEHARAIRSLLRNKMFTTALAVLRLQYEALTRSIWLIYVASDLDVDKLSAALSRETEAAASHIPMLAVMLTQLAQEPKATLALAGLLSFKTSNAPALNSFVHGGLHAMNRHATGYPFTLLQGVLCNSNGLMVMTAMALATLSGKAQMTRRVAALQLDSKFTAILPALANMPNS